MYAGSRARSSWRVSDSLEPGEGHATMALFGWTLTNQPYSDALRVFRPCLSCRAGDLPSCETGSIRTMADSCF